MTTHKSNKGVSGKKPQVTCDKFAIFNFQITLHSLMNHKKTLHQKTLKAFFHKPFQLWSQQERKGSTKLKYCFKSYPGEYQNMSNRTKKYSQIRSSQRTCIRNKIKDENKIKYLVTFQTRQAILSRGTL